MEKVSDETRNLRRTMRDLVALSALPAVWARYQPRQVAEGLADALLSALRLDVVYLRLPGQTEGQEIEVARIAGRPTTTDETRNIGRALAPRLDGGTADSAPSFLNPTGGGTERLVIVPIGGDSEGGVLVAGSRLTGFPSEEDHVLLTVGANQAATVLQRQRAEEALRKSEERFRFLVQNSSDIISLFDAEGTILYQAPSVERLLGRPPRDRIGRNIFRDPIVHPDDLGAKRAFFDAVLNQPAVPAKAEFRLQHADGSWRDIEAIGQNFLHDPGVAGIAANYRDMTERMRAEIALRESEERFRTLAKATNDAVWDWDLGTNKVWWSEGVVTLFGYVLERSEADPAWWLERVHPDDRAAVEAFIFEVVRGTEQSWVDEYRFRCADGSYKDVYDRGYVLRDGEGRAVRMIGAMLDITARKRAEEKLRESEQRWRSLTEALPQLVWTATPEGACDYFSTQWTEYTGVPECDLLGWRWLETLHPEDREPTRRFWSNSVAGRGAYDVVYRVRRLDGEYRWFKTRGVPIRDGEHGIFKWFGTCTDITDGKLAEEALRRAKEAAEAANRAKDEFLANVSHEIRTPMNAILGMTELALDTPLTGDQRQCLKTVKSAADSLLGLINDLLDFAKIEAGKLELDPAGFSLRSVVGDTLRALAVRAHKKGLELISHWQPDVPDALVGDAGRLRQVLLNLVGNAIKFTEQGEVVVRLGVAGSSAPEEVGLRFCVSDTGIGIPPEKQETIFRAFEQEDTSTTRKYGGTGLGLTIAARLVALMDGKITVESQPGRGSTFAFTAQFGRQPHQPEPAIARPPLLLRNLRVLIVDDNATNRQILEGWLRGWQMEPAAVGDGLAALDALWDAVTLRRPYALVLLDARMPDSDGLTLAAKIRKRAELSATRIVLLTSGERPGDLARSRDLRVNGHLLKPVQLEELLETIYRVMSRTDADAPLAAPTAPAEQHAEPLSPAGLRILVAEDNEFNTRHLEQLLARRGHAVRMASNGREALAQLGIDGEGSGGRPLPAPGPDSLTPPYDLMLLDLHMPELDGFEVIRAIREREQAAGGHLPVIALTARSRKEDREHCLAAGMDDYLAKPLRATELFAAIERAVSAHRVPQPTKPAVGNGTGLLDPAVLLAACGDDAEALLARCQDLRAYLPGRLAEVDDAVRSGDAPRLREAAHKLCGLLSVFSTSAAAVATNLEERAAGGRLEEARPLVGRLKELAAGLVREVDGMSLENLRRRAAISGG